MKDVVLQKATDSNISQKLEETRLFIENRLKYLPMGINLVVKSCVISKLDLTVLWEHQIDAVELKNSRVGEVCLNDTVGRVVLTKSAVTFIRAKQKKNLLISLIDSLIGPRGLAGIKHTYLIVTNRLLRVMFSKSGQREISTSLDNDSEIVLSNTIFRTKLNIVQAGYKARSTF